MLLAVKLVIVDWGTNHNDSEDDDRSGCRNVSHCHQQFFSELHSPGRSHYTNYWYSRVQTIYNIEYRNIPVISPLAYKPTRL